jgi:o-succinylbenzoate---CoA ligase
VTWFADRLVADHARTLGREPAVIDGARVLGWRELDALASEVAATLAVRGVAAGDRVAVVGPTGAVGAASILGILRSGAVAAPVPGGLTAREQATALEVLAPALVLRAGDLPTLEPGAASEQGLAAERGIASEPGTASEPTAASEPGTASERGLTAEPGTASVPTAASERDPEAPAVVVLTSGTTGRPKGVVLSSRALAASADAWIAALPPSTGWVMPLGLAHVAGLGILWRAIRARVPVRFVAAADPLRLLAAIHGTPSMSHVSLVPMQLARALDEARGAPPPLTLRAALVGGGPIPAALVSRALRGGWPVVPTYGLSETASGATALPTDEAWDLPGSAGRPLPGVRIDIVDPGPDGVGEIVVETEARFSGYLGQGDAAATPGEPVRTGDLGRVDTRGRLSVVDRRIDRIVRGGENVDPAEVESVLLTHPAVADAAVVGVPDPYRGQVPVAAVVLRDGGADLADGVLAAHARASLAGFKVPSRFVRLDALPRTDGGKLRREAVRALLAGEPAGELTRPGGDAIGWRVTGSGTRSLVLLHGTLSNAAQLGRLAGALAEPGAVTVHALDRRGSGSSRLVAPRPLDVSVHVADLIAYLDARGIQRADIVGVSFGGVIALETAARHPERVRAVVAYEPPYGALADRELLAWFRRLAADTAAAHATRGPAAAAETFLRAVAGEAAWARLPARARGYLEAEGDGALVDACLEGLAPDGLARITAPVAILTGSASEPFYAPLADALAARIPGARRDTLEGLTHTTPITQPGAVAPTILACLEPDP